MIDDLPEPIMNKLLGGMRTPLLPINQVDGDGVIHKDFARIRLIKEDEQVHPMFLPVKNQGNLEYFSGKQKEALERVRFSKLYFHPTTVGTMYSSTVQPTPLFL